MPCSDLHLYMDASSALLHSMQCQRCPSSAVCYGTDRGGSLFWHHARFATLANGNATAEECNEELSTPLLAVLIFMLVCLIASVCVFARRHARLRELNGTVLQTCSIAPATSPVHPADTVDTDEEQEEQVAL